MGRNVNDVIAALPKARREKVEAKAKQLSKEMIAYADSLSEVRKAVNKTQRDIGRKLGIGQGAVAQLEGRSDLLLSTLHKYMNAAGVKLVMIAETSSGEKIELGDIGNSIAKSGLPPKVGNTSKLVREVKRKTAVSTRGH